MSSSLYTLRNYISVPLHYALTGGIAAGAYMMGQPWAITTATTLTLGVLTPILWLNKEVMENHMEAHPNVHRYSPHLGVIVRDLFKASGLKAKKMVVYSFNPTKYGTNPYAEDEEIKFKTLGRRVRAANQYQRENRQYIDEKSLSGWEKIKFKLVEEFKGVLRSEKFVMNAAAIRLAKPVIMISEPMLKFLNHEEEKAVLAHEFAHAAAHHITLSLPIKIMNGIANITARLTQFAAMLSIGAWAFLGTIAGLMSAGMVMSKLQGYNPKSNDELTLPEIFRNKTIQRRTNLVMLPLVVGAFSMQSPTFLSIWLAAKSIQISTKLVSSSLSRSKEYQADRGAVTLGASPLALITSLRKINHAYKDSVKNAFDGEAVPEESALRKMWKRSTSTHPPLQARIERLVTIARENGYSEDSIEKAQKAPLDLEGYEHIPYEVIRDAMSRFVEKQDSTAPKRAPVLG